MSARDLSQMSMLELFRLDAAGQIEALTGGLLALERNATAADQLEVCMRAAHSLKGAARIVGLDVGVKVTHAMEDCFVAAQLGAVTLRQTHIDILLRGVDLLSRIADTAESETSVWTGEKYAEIAEFLGALASAILNGETVDSVPKSAERPAVPPAAPAALAEPKHDAEPKQAAEPKQVAAPKQAAETKPTAAPDDRDSAERVLRVTADNLNRLLGLAGESLVESRWLKPYTESVLRLKRLHVNASKSLDNLREILAELAPNARTEDALAEARGRIQECHLLLSQRLVEIEMFDGRSTDLAHRLYDAVLACRMRPFADGIRAFPRTVRDLGRLLSKQVRLEIVGENTQVDRDILEKLDAPLGHLLRNAIDHGIESADERLAAGKPAEGVVRLEARHSAGLLQITATDDGRGVNLDNLRTAIVQRKLTTAEIAQKLSEAELLEFLFLPGFSMKETVTEISGRGVGLDVVQNMIKQVRGTIRVSSQLGKGTCFQLQLPLTLSVVRTLLVEIGGEPYAFPLAHIVRTLKLPRDKVELLEGRQHFNLDGRFVGLVNAQQILGGREPSLVGDELSVLIVGDSGNTYGLIADRFLGERELVVQPLDARLGKIKDIAAGALMEDGLPVLIVDVEDMLRSVEKLVAVGRLSKVERAIGDSGKARKRVLVAEDSLTVRELERKLLSQAGYEVEVAVDGMDGWNMVRTGHFDLVVTDIDMPRMDGIELVALIKKDPNLRSLPVMIVSYKDREEDRQRGLEAGADYYLTKGSFHDETLLQAVVDLIGEAAPVKIGIVNDLPMAAEALRRVIALQPEYEVIWVAHDGAEAVVYCKQQTPDLVLMDLIMPGMSGVEATRLIMAGTPCAILIVTVNVGANANRVYEAMGYGALDAVDTPEFGSKNARVGAALLLEKIESISKRIDKTNDTLRTAKLVFEPPPASHEERLVAIGASAGGPAALAKVLSGLPVDFPAAIVIVQHVDAQFAIGLADWLSQQSAIPVRVAGEGDRPTIGTVLLAGTSDHLTLRGTGRLGYTHEPADYVYRPSVDVFFNSVRQFWRFETVGVLLTGMGRDGAVGLKALRDKGFYTIAQDESSSAVYGMPKAAAMLDAAVDILPLEQIAPRLISTFTRRIGT